MNGIEPEWVRSQLRDWTNNALPIGKEWDLTKDVRYKDLEKLINKISSQAVQEALEKQKEELVEKGKLYLFDHPQVGSYKDGWNDGIDIMTDILWGVDLIKDSTKEER